MILFKFVVIFQVRMKHIPVLKKEIIEAFDYLSKRKGVTFVDGTLGLGGHTIALVNQYGKEGDLFRGIDRDQKALQLARDNVNNNATKLAHIVDYWHGNFKEIKNICEKFEIEKIDGVLLDLGVSSMQLDERERGFSFNDLDQKLDMRMDQTQGRSAADILNIYSEESLASILKDYGDERFAKKIARNIMVFRKKAEIKTVRDFVEIISHSIPGKVKATGKIHFATRSFQAIRIEVNGELKGLKEAIFDFVELLEPGGKIAVISFHSLEDEIVKKAFRELTGVCSCPPKMPCICNPKKIVEILTRKPIIASEEETNLNPRSRSAKLRIAQKV